MKKYSKIGWGILLVAVLALAGCGGKKRQNQVGQNVPEATRNGNAQKDTGQSTAEKVQQKLFDWLTTGAGAKCFVEDPRMGQVTIYASGEKAKVEGFSFMPMSSPNSIESSQQSPKEEKGTMLNDGQWVYMWSGKSGIKFNIEEMKKMSEEFGASQENQNQNQQEAMDWKGWAKKIDEGNVKYNCSPATLSESDFNPPADVQFQDWGEIMRGFMKMSEEMKKKMPDIPPASPQ